MMPSSFKEEDPRPEDEVEQEIIVIRPLSSEPATYSTSLPSCCYGQAIFPTPTPIFSITTTTVTLPTPSFQDSFEDFSLLHSPIHSTLSSSSISLSSPPSYSDSVFPCFPYCYRQTCLLFVLYSNFTFTKLFTSFLSHI